MYICDPQVNEIKRKYVNVNRCIRNLEWNAFQYIYIYIYLGVVLFPIILVNHPWFGQAGGAPTCEGGVHPCTH